MGGRRPGKGEAAVREGMRRIAAVQREQDENERIRRLIGQAKDLIEEERLRSRSWLGDFEAAAPRDGRGRARVAELRDIHAYTAQEADTALEEAFASNKVERGRLLREEERLMEERRGHGREAGKEGE